MLQVHTGILGCFHPEKHINFHAVYHSPLQRGAIEVCIFLPAGDTKTDNNFTAI